METNYKVKKFLKALLSTTCSFLILSVSAQSITETTVFTDDFERSELDGGNPFTSYTIVKEFISGDEADDPNLSGYDYGTDKLLRIAVSTGSVGRSGMFGQLSDYADPFNAKLNDIAADSVVWTFNTRDNRGTPVGFDDGQLGTAIVLLSDEANYATANGYAVVAYGATKSDRKYRLVKFTDGINATSKLTTIAEVLSSLETNVYFSIRAVYIKGTNTWKLYGRTDSPTKTGSFLNPTTGIFDEMSEGIDDTFVNTSMTYFGFLLNYKSYSSGATVFLVDNYTVRTYQNLSSVNHPLANEMYKTNLVSNGIQIESAKAKATLYDLTGTALSVVNVDGQASIQVKQKGLYLLKVELPGNISATEKIIIQ